VATEFEVQARRMIATQLRPRGIRDEQVLDAMQRVPRHEFVPAQMVGAAYEDRPLPIGERETISQPYMVAAITQAAQVMPGDKALEVGGGSGYQAAVLAQLGAIVYMVEINPELAEAARERLARLEYTQASVFSGDGSEGLPAHAPYDVIILSAAAPRVPQPLLDQLAEGGRLVAPIGNLYQQCLLRLHREHGQIATQRLDPCQFVPLVGRGGWPDWHNDNGSR